MIFSRTNFYDSDGQKYISLLSYYENHSFMNDLNYVSI